MSGKWVAADAARATGYCVRAISGRSDRSAARYTLIPIMPNPTAVARHLRQTKKLPPFWPETANFATSCAVYELAEAMRTPEADADWSLSGSKLSKASGIASVLATILGIESFALVCDREGQPLSVHSVGMQPGDHAGSLHVLSKARRLFMDLPPYEQSYVWEDVREGRLLTERERDGIVPGTEFSGFINPNSPYVQTGRVGQPNPVVSPPPNPISKKAEVDDPGLIAALERLRLAAGF